MARVTVEDCLEKVENRFALVHLTAQRSRQIQKGSVPLVRCRNKPIVTALREIADSQVSFRPTTPSNPSEKADDPTPTEIPS